jgi:hypothetical protein
MDDDDENIGGFDFTAGMTQFLPSQGDGEEEELLAGDNLVAQPRKVRGGRIGKTGEGVGRIEGNRTEVFSPLAISCLSCPQIF